MDKVKIVKLPIINLYLTDIVFQSNFKMPKYDGFLLNCTMTSTDIVRHCFALEVDIDFGKKKKKNLYCF